MNTKRTEQPRRYFIVTAADGSEWECRGADLGEMLRALPGFRGFRRVR